MMQCKNNLISTPVIVGESLTVYTVVYDGNTAKNLTGYTATGRIGKRGHPAEISCAGTVEDQITYTGHVGWAFTSAQMDTLTAGAWILELELTDGTNVHKIQETIQVFDEVENEST